MYVYVYIYIYIYACWGRAVGAGGGGKGGTLHDPLSPPSSPPLTKGVGPPSAKVLNLQKRVATCLASLVIVQPEIAFSPDLLVYFYFYCE